MWLGTQALPGGGLLVTVRRAGRDDHNGNLTSRTLGDPTPVPMPVAQ